MVRRLLAYKSLITVAELGDLPKAVPALRANLDEALAMASCNG